MLGQLAAGMGLIASGARIEADFCTHLNVPCLIEWERGFGVVVKSDANGFYWLTRLGWVRQPEHEKQPLMDLTWFYLKNKYNA